MTAHRHKSAGDSTVLGFILATGLLAVIATVAASPAHALGIDGEWTQIGKLLAPDAAPGDFLGNAVAVDGSTLVIGSPSNDDGGDGTGSAYVFERDPVTGGWTPVAKLRASDRSPGDLFGVAVALQGDTLFVAIIVSDFPVVTPGAVYVFQRDPGTGNWVEIDKLVPSDGEANNFGVPLALDGDTLAVGAVDADDLGTESGAVYLFERDSTTGAWLEADKLLASDGGTGGRFGERLAISEDTLVVGVSAFSNRRVAYVFERDAATGAWLEIAALEPASGHTFDSFGDAVTIESETLVVGAENDDDAGDSAGAAYVFARDDASGAWLEQQKLVPFDGQNLSAFGNTMAIHGELLVIGDRGDRTSFSSDGSLYVYARDSGSGEWLFAAKLLASDPDTFDHLSLSLAFDGETIIAGANDDAEGDSGAAYVFDRLALGGSLTGGEGRRVECRNETTGQEVVIDLARSTFWDCSAAGLIVAPFDLVTQQSRLTADGTTVSGVTSGLALDSVLCSNLTTGQRLAVAPSPADSWDCERAGLPVSAGDVITMTVSGVVE